MPDLFCINELHGDKMLDWLNRKKASAYEDDCLEGTYIGATNFGYIKQKLGYIIPVEYSVSYSYGD